MNESFSHHRVEIDGMRQHYLLAGSGEPVVLLHGFPETSYAWRKIIPGLSEHYTVLAPDLRGCGDTDRPSGGYDKRTVATMSSPGQTSAAGSAQPGQPRVG